jgi:hypothetical protein
MARIEEGVMLERRYRLLRWIRKGTIGDVWEAEDRPQAHRREEHIWTTDEQGQRERRVAIEIIADPRAEDTLWYSRFRRGVLPALWPWFSHPNAAPIRGLGEDSSTRFIISELVEGEDIGRLVRRDGQLEARIAVRFAAGIAAALEAAHAAGIVHGRLRPESVMVTPDGRAELLDLGLVGPWRNASSRSLSEAEEEDVRALAGILLFMLLGGPIRHAPEIEDTEEGRARMEIPERLAELCRLAMGRGEGHTSAGEFAAGLREFLGDVPSRVPGATPVEVAAEAPEVEPAAVAHSAHQSGELNMSRTGRTPAGTPSTRSSNGWDSPPSDEAGLAAPEGTAGAAPEPVAAMPNGHPAERIPATDSAGEPEPQDDRAERTWPEAAAEPTGGAEEQAVSQPSGEAEEVPATSDAAEPGQPKEVSAAEEAGPVAEAEPSAAESEASAQKLEGDAPPGTDEGTLVGDFPEPEPPAQAAANGAGKRQRRHFRFWARRRAAGEPPRTPPKSMPSEEGRSEAEASLPTQPRSDVEEEPIASEPPVEAQPETSEAAQLLSKLISASRQTAPAPPARGSRVRPPSEVAAEAGPITEDSEPPSDAVTGEEEAARLAAEAEAARVAEAEAARVAEAEAARVAEAERVAAEAEAARLEAERVASEEEAARLEAERVAAEEEAVRVAEAERLEAERLEAERLEAEAEQLVAEEEAKRLAAQEEAARLAEAERLEAERLAAEEEAARLAEAERLEAERLAAEEEAKRLEAASAAEGGAPSYGSGTAAAPREPEAEPATGQAIPLPPAAVTVEEPVPPTTRDDEPLVVLEPAASLEPTVVLGEPAPAFEPEELASRAEPETETQARPSLPADESISRPTTPRSHVGRNVLIAGIALVVAGGATFGIVRATQTNPAPPPAQSSQAPPAQSPTPAVTTVAVPQLAGLTVAAARIELVQAGLEPGTVLPADGPPGRVVNSLPAANTQVQPHSSITLYVGVSPDRQGG